MLPFTVTKPGTKQEISIALDAHDTKLDSGRELTNGNLFSVRIFEEGNHADYSAACPTIAEHAPIRNRGRRFDLAHFER